MEQLRLMASACIGEKGARVGQLAACMTTIAGECYDELEEKEVDDYIRTCRVSYS